MTIAYRTTVLVNAHIMPKITSIIGVFIVLRITIEYGTTNFRHVEQNRSTRRTKQPKHFEIAFDDFPKCFDKSNKVKEK